MITRRLILPLLFLVAIPPSRTAAEPDLPEGGTVLLLGDSITWQNMYAVLVESYLRRRYPEKMLKVINRGLRGDTAGGALSRLERDVVPFDPDLVVVMLGMNDGGMKGHNRGLLRRYLRDMNRLIDALQRRTRARLLLVTPTTVDPISERWREYNEMLQAMSAGLMELARQKKVPALDLNSHFRRYSRNALKLTPPVLLMNDALHPGPAGHLLIADHLLRVLDPGVKRKNWTRIRVDGAAPRGKAHAFDLVHDHLNVYLPARMLPGGRLASFDARWNQDALWVAGLKGRFRLRIGNRVLGEFSGDLLSAGVSVDVFEASPWVEEARRVHQLIWSKWRLQYFLWDPQARGLDALRDVGGRELADHSLGREEARERLGRIEAELRSVIEPRAPVTYRVVVDTLHRSKSR